MPITFGQARKILSPYANVAGVCPSSEDMELFVKKILQYMLISGAHGDTRTFCFNAVAGCFTIPTELETPLKIKMGDEIGTVWDRWYDYKHYGDEPGCMPAQNALVEDSNRFSTIYDLQYPSEVCTFGVNDESEDAHIIVSGVDKTGREIVTQHKGEHIIGEYLSIVRGKLMRSQAEFAKITEIKKTRTNGYVTLFGRQKQTGTKQFLADYSPFDEFPRYRRFKLLTKCPHSIKVTVIGRIRLKDFYSDNDLIPFENIYAIELAAQACQASRNNDAQTSVTKDQVMKTMLDRENSSKNINNGASIEVFKPLSFGSLPTLL